MSGRSGTAGRSRPKRGRGSPQARPGWKFLPGASSIHRLISANFPGALTTNWKTSFSALLTLLAAVAAFLPAGAAAYGGPWLDETGDKAPVTHRYILRLIRDENAIQAAKAIEPRHQRLALALRQASRLYLALQR